MNDLKKLKKLFESENIKVKILNLDYENNEVNICLEVNEKIFGFSNNSYKIFEILDCVNVNLDYDLDFLIVNYSYELDDGKVIIKFIGKE